MEETLQSDLIAVLVRYRLRFAIAFIYLLLSNLLTIFNPLLFRQAVMAMDLRSGTPEGKLYESVKTLFGSSYSSLWLWASLLLLVALAAAFFKYKMRTGFISISREAECRLRKQLFDKIQSQSSAFYDKHAVGELLSRFTNDIAVYRDVLGPGVMYPIYCVTLLIPGAAALLTISIPMAALSMLPIIFIPLINRILRHLIYTLSLSVQEKLGLMSGMVQEQYSGVRIVKSYEAEETMGKVFNEEAYKLSRDSVKLSYLQGLIYSFFTFLTKLTTILLMILAGAIILKGWGELSSADFVSFMWIQSYIYFPVLMLGWVLPIYERGRAAYDRLLQVYREPIEVKDQGVSMLQFPPKADIVFNNLTFSYPKADKPVLKGISIAIKGGQFVGITGPVGAGKTTLLRLLDREYEIPHGMISIAGKDIHEYPLSAFHRQIATVEQVPFLFSITIAGNIAIGLESATEEEVVLVAQDADLHETVLGFPQQYGTIVGERGMTLSGGQKQRVAIARSFLVDRSILLLDDAFSSVDSSTEKRIFDTMKENFQGRTVFLITHRASILSQLDRVIVIDGGLIVEEGTPAELLSRKGHFRALWELQNLDEQKE